MMKIGNVILITFVTLVFATQVSSVANGSGMDIRVGDIGFIVRYLQQGKVIGLDPQNGRVAINVQKLVDGSAVNFNVIAKVADVAIGRGSVDNYCVGKMVIDSNNSSRGKIVGVNPETGIVVVYEEKFIPEQKSDFLVAFPSARFILAGGKCESR